MRYDEPRLVWTTSGVCVYYFRRFEQKKKKKTFSAFGPQVDQRQGTSLLAQATRMSDMEVRSSA
jgi:hypothetical protein